MPYGYRRNQNRMRHHEGLPRYLEGFLVAGDAVYTLNPVYALGMTAAAILAQGGNIIIFSPSWLKLTEQVYKYRTHT